MAFSAQIKALLLLINDSGMQLFVWQHKQLTWLGGYDGTPEDLENFAATIQSYAGFPVVLVTDVLEESFRHDTIVHVSGSDRTALIKRKLDFAFRNTRYRQGRITGRLKQGRRDDSLLLSAITKPELLDLWVQTLVKQKFAVQSVTSVAHLLQHYCLISKLETEPYLLIITLEADNSLRQTFLKNGQVMFSRMNTLNLRDTRQPGQEIHLETMQIRQYFERIQFLPYEALLQIRVYSAYNDADLQLAARNSDTNRFEVFDIRSLPTVESTQLQDQPLSPIHHFIASIFVRQQPDNVYAPPSASKYQDLKRLAATLWLSSAALLAVALAAATPKALGVMDQWQQRDQMVAQTQPLRSQYATLSQRFPETPVPPREMELMVQTYDSIRRQIVSPVDTLNMLAQALAMAPGLVLRNIEWELEEKPFVPVMDEYGNMSTNTSLPGVTADNAFLGYVLQGRTQVKATITGEAYSPDSFRDAQEQVNALVAALAANPGVAVFASQMPTDVRTDIRVATLVADGEVRAPFTLEVTLGEAAP